MYLDSSIIASFALVGSMIVISGFGLKLLRDAMRRNAERARH